MLVSVQSGSSDAAAPGSGAAKSGMASLMRRAVAQARAEAAATKAQAVGAGGQAAGASAQTNKPEQQAKPAAAGEKQALAELLKKAAQKMQQEEAGSESVTAAKSQVAAVSDSRQSLPPDLSYSRKVADQDQAQAASQDTATDDVHLSAISRSSSFNSTTGLMSEEFKRPPQRNQSLGERLGAMLRGALSLPRQSSYMPIPESDSPDDPTSSSQLPPVRRRALPRDASYLPEWLNQTLSSSSEQPSQDELAADSEAEKLLSKPADEDIKLPQWVDWSAMQPQEDKKAPLKPRPGLLILPGEESSSVTPSVPDAAPSAPVTVPTPKGQRLFEFWQQKAVAASETKSTADARMLQPSLPLLRPRHSPGSASVPLTRHTLAKAQPSATEPAASTHMPELQLSTASGSHDVHSAQNRRWQAPRPSVTAAELAAELAATSQLVQQQSLQQAELMQGLEHALSELSQQRLLIQNPIAQPEASASPDEAGNMLAVVCAIPPLYTCLLAAHAAAPG